MGDQWCYFQQQHPAAGLRLEERCPIGHVRELRSLLPELGAVSGDLGRLQSPSLWDVFSVLAHGVCGTRVYFCVITCMVQP